MKPGISLLLVLNILLSFWLVLPTDATLGVDLSTSASTSVFSCLKNEGYEFVIVRAYESIGKPDSAAVYTIANAMSAGFKHVDVYMFPCPRCVKSAREQVSEMGM